MRSRVRALIVVLAAAVLLPLSPWTAPAGAGGHAPTARSAAASALVYASGVAGAVRIKATPSGLGFYLLTPDGQVHAFGDAVALGNAHLPHAAVSLAVTRSGHGYWVFDANGCTAAFGDAAQFSQSVCGKPLNGPVLDAATTPDGNGYWLVANDGGMFSFGDAPFLGSMGGRALNAPVVGMAPAPSGKGYWEVASDGGIFAFSAPFLGSTGNLHLNRPVVGMVASGGGYMMVAADGGIFNFGNPFFGSLGASPPPAAMVATAPSVDHSGVPNGYWMLDGAGNVYGFGSAWLPSGSGHPPGPGAPKVTPSAGPAYPDDGADPDLFRLGSTYYTFTTGTTWGNRIGVLTSSNAMSGWATTTGQPYGSTAFGSSPAWEQDNTQTSPGVYQWAGRFIMFYDAVVSSNGHYCLSVATSSSADAVRTRTARADRSSASSTWAGRSTRVRSSTPTGSPGFCGNPTTDRRRPCRRCGLRLSLVMAPPSPARRDRHVQGQRRPPVGNHRRRSANGAGQRGALSVVHRRRLAVRQLRGRLCRLCRSSRSVHPANGRPHLELLRAGGRTGRWFGGQRRQRQLVAVVRGMVTWVHQLLVRRQATLLRSADRLPVRRCRP